MSTRIHSKEPSPEYRANYDQIDWSQGKPAPIDGVYDEVGHSIATARVKTVSTIRDDKPHVSVSAAIHADQVPAFNEVCARGTHYDKQGHLVSTSWGARQRELQRRGMSDPWS